MYHGRDTSYVIVMRFWVLGLLLLRTLIEVSVHVALNEYSGISATHVTGFSTLCYGRDQENLA